MVNVQQEPGNDEEEESAIPGPSIEEEDPIHANRTSITDSIEDRVSEGKDIEEEESDKILFESLIERHIGIKPPQSAETKEYLYIQKIRSRKRKKMELTDVVIPYSI